MRRALPHDRDGLTASMDGEWFRHSVQGRRRERIRYVIIALLPTIVGLASGTAFIGGVVSTMNVTGTSGGVPACAFYSGLNTTDSTSYLAVGGSGTSTATVTLHEWLGYTYVYLVNELVAGCTATPTGRTTIVSLSATGTSASGTGLEFFAMFLTGGLPTTSGSGSVCSTTCSSGTCTLSTPCYPDNPSVNPTSENACDNNGQSPAAKSMSLFPPWNGWAGTAVSPYQEPDVWTWSMNSSSWTADACDAGHGSSTGVPPPALAVAQGITSATYYWYVSFAFVSVPQTISTEASVSLSMSVSTQ